MRAGANEREVRDMAEQKCTKCGADVKMGDHSCAQCNAPVEILGEVRARKKKRVRRFIVRVLFLIIALFAAISFLFIGKMLVTGFLAWFF